jgi:hypothetical protein
MKYLSKRDQFLKESRFTGLQTYEKTPYSGESFSIYESSYGAGPFVNDIGWNDSLLGRLINHIIRKVKIAYGKMRLKGVIRQLKATFQDIIDRGKVAAQDAENKSQVARVILYSFFWELVQAVDNGAKVLILRRLTQSALDTLESIEDFDEKESLKAELEAFLKFLEQFDDEDGEGEEDDESDDEDGEDSEEGESEETTDKTEGAKKAYSMMMVNLKSIITIINKVATMKIGDELVKPKRKVHKTLPNETVNSISKANNVSADLIWTKNANTKIDNKGTTLSQWIDKAQNNPANKSKKIVNGKETFVNKDKNDIILPKDALLLLEKDVFAGDRQVKDPKQLQQQQKVKDATKSGAISGGQTTKEIGFEDRHTKETFAKLKAAVDILVGKDSYAVTAKFLQDLTDSTQGGNLNPTKLKNIKALYNEINIYLRDNKSQLDSLRGVALYKEGSLEELSDKGKLKSIAKKIAIFSVTIMKFKGENLALSKDLNAGIKSFIDSFTLIQKIPISKPEVIKKSDNEEKVNDSYLRKYNSFIKLIKEAEGDEESNDEEDDTPTQDGKAKKLPTGSVSEKIKDFFDKNCKGVRAFTIDKTEALKISKNLENTKVDKFIIDGFDPIIEILRLFNRAYKIYTTRIISKRSQNVTGGTAGPSAGTAMEYTPLGPGGDAPYRHNTTFDIWEDAVYDIMGNREYQVIFDKDTILRIGNEERAGKGVALRTFIFDMLEGEKLYGKEGGGTSKGTQATFLEKYFGDTGEVDKKLEVVAIEDNTKENAEMQDDINKGKTEIKLSRMANVDARPGTIFTLSLTPSTSESLVKEASSDATQLTFLITEDNNGNLGLIYFESFGALDGLFKSIGNYTTLKGDFNDLKIKPIAGNGNRWRKNYTKIKSADFRQKLSKGSKVKINHVADQNYTTLIDGSKFVINDIFWLTKKNKEGKNIIFEMDDTSTEKAKAWFKKQDMKWSFTSIIPEKAKIEKV